MKSGKLLEVFEKLTSKEIREISKCVRSPWFNNRPSVISAFDFLAECRNELKITPTKEQIHRRIFPGKEYEDIRVRNAMSFLLKVIERFFALREMEDSDTDVHLALAKVYRRMQLPKHYKQTVKAGETLMDRQLLRNADYYTGQYRLEFEKYRSLSAKRDLKDINLQLISDNLDVSYLAQKLRQACFSISHQAVYSKEYDFGLLPHLLEVAKEEKYQSIPAISVYYNVYFSLTRPEEESYFYKFKKLLIESNSFFPKSELSDLYLFGTNYCIRRMNKNARQYGSDALILYKESLKDDVLLRDGVMLHTTFNNIVTLCLIIEEFEFLESFIEKYKNFLAPEHREPTYIFSLARLNYQRGNFEEALPLLQREVYRDLLLNLSSKTLMAKIFFESDELDVLISHLDAMQQFIRRKKVMGYHRANFQNFIRFLRKITELPGYGKEKKELLKQEIGAVKAVVERKWLLKHLE